jgi:hypothetical protein
MGPAPVRSTATASLPAPAIQTTPAYGAPTTAMRPSVTPASLPKAVAQAPAVQQQKPGRVWLQIAADGDPKALAAKFRSIKSSIPELMKGITPYMAQGSDKARLVIGPFRGQSDADYFAEDLDSVGVRASRWTNSPSDRIVPLGG